MTKCSLILVLNNICTSCFTVIRRNWWIKESLTQGKTVYKESYNEHLIKASYKFPIEEMTEGGKEKDKNLKVPKLDKVAIESILNREYN